MSQKIGNLPTAIHSVLPQAMYHDIVELRNSQLDFSPVFNPKHSNSEGLPERDGDSQQELKKIGAKEKEHYNFLNSLRQKLNVDSERLVDLEARISGKSFVNF